MSLWGGQEWSCSTCILMSLWGGVRNGRVVHVYWCHLGGGKEGSCSTCKLMAFWGGSGMVVWFMYTVLDGGGLKEWLLGP